MLMNVLTSTLQCEFMLMNGIIEKSKFVTILEIKFYTTYEANVSTDCAYLKYVPHVRGVSAVMCMTCAWQGEVEGQCQCCRCGVAACCCQRDVRMQRENGGREQLSSPGSRAVKGTSRNLIRLAKILYATHQLGYMQRSVQISCQLSTYHV